ncbi:MAG: hypothetical protein FWJ85_08370 [Solitalea sp.]
MLSVSIVPLNYIHRHGGEHPLISKTPAGGERFSQGHPNLCPVCSCIGTQFDLPVAVWEVYLPVYPFSHQKLRPDFQLPAERRSISPRGPPLS